MSDARSNRRRAVLTGLAPFLSESQLARALAHWDSHFADLSQPTLQKFVFDVAAEDGLRAQRSSILLSLVKAMNLPPEQLLPDPAARHYSAREVALSAEAAAAFSLFMTQLLECVPASGQHNVRLDLLDSLDNPNLPAELVQALGQWLNHRQPLTLAPAQPVVLRALINRAYVIFCERLGPVMADKYLAQAINFCQKNHPRLATHLTDLL